MHTHQYTYVELGGKRGSELYDLSADPYEMTNIAESQPQVAEALASDLRVLLEGIDDPWGRSWR